MKYSDLYDNNICKMRVNDDGLEGVVNELLKVYK